MNQKSEDGLHPIELVTENLNKYANDKRTKVVLISTGAYNPIHRMHLEVFKSAKTYLEETHKFCVIGGQISKMRSRNDSNFRYLGFISPSHDQYVEAKLADDFIPSVDRLKMIELAIQDAGEASWLVADGWEANRPNFISFSSVTWALDRQLKQKFPNEKIVVMYLCGADLILRCGGFSKLGENPVICVGRPGFSEQVKKFKETRGYELYFVPMETESISSTLIRDTLRSGGQISTMTYSSVEKYLIEKQYYHPNKN